MKNRENWEKKQKEKGEKYYWLKQTIQEAYKKKWVFLHININSWDNMQNLLQVNVNLDNKIFFLAVTEEIIKFLGGYKIVGQTFQFWKKIFKNNNTYLHLDHSLSLANCQKAMESGFDSVMFDGSSLSIEKNIEKSQKIINLGKKYQVIVEIEVGNLEDGNSKIKEITEMLKFGQPDLLAIAIGNFHGYKKKAVYLDLNHLNAINKIVKMPLVLHGASGIERKIIKKIAKLGICKINYDSFFQKKYAQKIEEYLQKTSKEKEKWFWWSKIHHYATKKNNQELIKILQIWKKNDKQ